MKKSVSIVLLLVLLALTFPGTVAARSTGLAEPAETTPTSDHSMSIADTTGQGEVVNASPEEDTEREVDIDKDGEVDDDDLAILRASYRLPEEEAGFNADADINKDFLVDLRDLAILGAFYGERIAHVTSPVAEATNSKAIVSHLGELTDDIRYVGEVIRYKIYYQNTSTGQPSTDIGIVDKLDANLSQVTVFNGGKYDKMAHAVIWEIDNVASGQGNFVEFEAVIGEASFISNKALVQIGGEFDPLSIDASKDNVLETNSVKTKVCDPPDLGWIPFSEGADLGERPHSYMKDETTTGIMINFDIPGMFVHQATRDGVLYHKLSIPGYDTSLNVGKPELPLLGQAIEVPFGVDFDIEIFKSESIELQYYNVYPAQEPIIQLDAADEVESAPAEFALDKEAYLTDNDYPSELGAIEAEDIGVVRGHRVVFLKINPVQYNPVTRKIKAFSNIEVRVVYDHPAQIERVDSQKESQAFEDLLQASVLNYKPPHFFGPAGPGGATSADEPRKDCDYLIITHGDFYDPEDAGNPVVRFQDWKMRKGLNTCVVDVADIPDGDTAVGIRDYIQDAYDNWSRPPTYVLLVGDVEFIPTNYETAHPYYSIGGKGARTDPATGLEVDTMTATDLYYAAVDGDDYFPDIFLGRISVDTLAQAETVIDKILDYEQDPPADPDFYTDTSLVRLFEDDTDGPWDTNGDGVADKFDACPSDGQEDCGFGIVKIAEGQLAFLENEGYHAARIYNRSGNFVQGPLVYTDGANLPANLTIAGGFPWNGNTNDIIDAFEDGNFLVTYLGHGNRAGFGLPGFQKADLVGLNNNDLTPVSFALACNMGWFDNESDDFGFDAAGTLINNINPPDNNTPNNNECFAEEIMRLNNGGVVATIASSRISWALNNRLGMGMYDAIWPDYDPEIGKTAVYSMGQINTYSKLYLSVYQDTSNKRQLTIEMFNLLGDPEMPIWTEEPASFEVEHPEGIGSTGEQDFIVTVTDDESGEAVLDAVVALTSSSSIIAIGQPDPAGDVRFTLGDPPFGDMAITVTAHNYRPYEGNIEVSPFGALLNRLDPDNGVEEATVCVGAQNFFNGELVDIYFGEQLMMSTMAGTDGSFGQVGDEDVSFKVASPHDLGPVNIMAHGQTSGHYAVDVFQVRTQNPIDLFMYDQWDKSTWYLADGKLTWNNPDIELFNEDGDPVSSKELTPLESYTVRAKVHNDTDFKANGVKVTFKWAAFGAGQPKEKVWQIIDTVTLDIEADSYEYAEADWAPATTGHQCILVEIYHVEDTNEKNNEGQENCQVGATSSPAKVSFFVWNPTATPSAVHLELRQLTERGQEEIWPSRIEHPEPQVIYPYEKKQAFAIIEAPVSAKEGQQAEFVLTAYIDGEIIGGVNFSITKGEEVGESNPQPSP